MYFGKQRQKVDFLKRHGPLCSPAECLRVSDVAEAVATHTDRFIKRYCMSNSNLVCEIMCWTSPKDSVHTTAEVSHFSGSMNTALCDF